MPLYRALAKHFINNSIVEEGDTVEYDGKPGQFLELIEDEAPASKAKGKKGAAAQVIEEQAGE
jgi:hypothetical protein